VLHAWALFLTAGFVVLMLFGRLRPALAGVTASVFAFGAVSVWSWLLGTRWRDLELAVIRAGWEFCRQLLEQANLSPDRAAGLKTYVDLLAESMPAVAQLLPALLVLSAIPGVCLAWSWYWRIAASPSGPPAARFSDFTFSDQFIWLVIGSLAAALAPIPASWQPLLANLALVTAGLYAGRGAAVAWTSVEGFPLVILVLMAVGLAFILPVALGGFAALGVADTWVNFRRRYAVVPGGE
jgi:hypothetical protein